MSQRIIPLNLGFASILVLALAACSKDATVEPSDLSVTEVVSGSKDADTYFMRYVGGTPLFSFQIQESGICYGEVRRDVPVSYPSYSAVEFGTGHFRVPGNYGSSAYHCQFAKGPNASTFGPWYRVIPMNATRKRPGVNCLLFRMKRASMPGVPGAGHKYFSYDVASNTWTAGTSAQIMNGLLNLEWSVQPMGALPYCD